MTNAISRYLLHFSRLLVIRSVMVEDLPRLFSVAYLSDLLPFFVHMWCDVSSSPQPNAISSTSGCEAEEGILQSSLKPSTNFPGC